MPYFITRLENTSTTQPMTVHFPGAGLVFPLPVGGATHLGASGANIPILAPGIPATHANSIVVVIAIFPGLNWYLWSDYTDNVFLQSDVDPPTAVAVAAGTNPANVTLVLDTAPMPGGAPRLVASLR